MKTLSELQHYRFRAARALLLIHERVLREFVEVWRRAQAAGVQLPASNSPNYQSLAALLRHVLRVPQMNMLWICQQLGLPAPVLPEPPPVERVAAEAEAYLDDLLPRLREPLAAVEGERFVTPVYPSRWQQDYTIDSMLEHLVAHALKHTFQLEELLAAQMGA